MASVEAASLVKEAEAKRRAVACRSVTCTSELETKGAVPAALSAFSVKPPATKAGTRRPPSKYVPWFKIEKRKS